MNKEFLSILGQLERERGLDRSVLIEAVKHALEVAARKISKFTAPGADVRVEVDNIKGDIKVYIGEKEIVSKEFGRIAAQTARQVIIQKIREAEKENVYTEFKSKEGSIVSGVVYRLEKKAVILDLMGKSEGVVPHAFLSSQDRFKLGERVKAYVYEVKREHGAQIVLSRRHEGLVKKLFELEVPEIYEGIVEVKSISREAGERTKIAVFSKDSKVDCIGACVGIRGSRVKNIIDELRGEKIDIVRWSEDAKEYIKAALSPANISSIELDRENRRALVIVPHDQLSLAIGKKGQNVRLASKLVNWEIDVRSREGIEAETKEVLNLKSVGKKICDVLAEAGYGNLSLLAKANPKGLAELKGIGVKKAVQIVTEAAKKLEEKRSSKNIVKQEKAKDIVKEESKITKDKIL